MQILAHRGYWKTHAEKNTLAAFERSFEMRFGMETDVRDLGRQLVISHDPPGSNALPLHTLLALHRQCGQDVPLALNVKADGLQRLLPPLLEQFGVNNCFVFDMSIPDALAWLRTPARVFTRQSEIESAPAFYEQAHGVWLDALFSDWWDSITVRRHLEAGKQVCVVSSELHGRDPLPAWRRLVSTTFAANPNLMLCTDRPDVAREFFHGQLALSIR